MKRLLFFSFLALAIAACQTPADTAEPTSDGPAFDEAAARAELSQMDAAYAAGIAAGDGAAIAALHAVDAVVLPNRGSLLVGREAITADFLERFSETSETTLTTGDVGFSEAGDLAFVYGATGGPGGGSGKYLTVYRRADEGWEIIADTWNDDTPLAEETDN